MSINSIRGLEEGHASETGTVDWERVKGQVMGDDAFLVEIMGGFREEAYEASLLMLHGIDGIDFLKCFKAAHMIMGTAAYLCCYDVQNCAKQIQDLAAEGTHIGKFDENRKEPIKWKGAELRLADHIWIDIKRTYKKFVVLLKLLNVEIDTVLNHETEDSHKVTEPASPKSPKTESKPSSPRIESKPSSPAQTESRPASPQNEPAAQPEPAIKPAPKEAAEVKVKAAGGE